MTFWELVALGLLACGRAIRTAFRSAVALTWLPMLALQALVILALAVAAHPLLSGFMAPLLRAVSGDDALRYPQGFHRLPALAAQAWFFGAAIVGPLCTGAAARAFAASGAGRPALAGTALLEALRRWPSLWLAALPGALVVVGLDAALAQLAGVRISGPTRALLPLLAGGLQIAAQAACFFPPMLVALEDLNPFVAIARIPSTLEHGFVPAAVVLLLVAAVMQPFGWVAPWALGDAGHDLPEVSGVLAVAQGLALAAAGLIASGAGAFAYLAALAPGEELR
ncbi:MAG TPA: hypothetical protein VMH61_01445 [Candidatus Acidoferrales bacterium]|nr:hypothetical protein [Candidatus Acidoferrales bacterium]